VVDEGGDGGIDARELLAGGDARGSGGDDFLGVASAGLDAALHTAGADLVGQIEAFAGLGGRRCGPTPRQQFFSDLGYQPVEIGVGHEDAFLEYCCSISMIFWTRAWCRPPAKGRLQPGT
jgi:hypothetical protein